MADVSLRLLPPAQYELEEIVRLHMALSGRGSAKSIADAIYRALDQLTLFPLSRPTIREPELRAQGYRYTIVNQSLLIYRLIGDTVFVYHIAHGKTDYPKLFRSDFF